MPRRFSPRLAQLVAQRLTELLVLAVATGMLWALVAAAAPNHTPAPAGHVSTTERTTEPMGHGGPR